MKTRRFLPIRSLLAASLLLAGLATGDSNELPPPQALAAEKPEPGEPVQPLLDTMASLIDLLEAQGLLDRRDPQLRRQLVDLLLVKAGTPATKTTVANDDTIAATPPASRLQGPFGVRVRSAYLAIEMVGDDLPQRLEQAWHTPPASAAAALIVDLRQANGQASPATLAAVEQQLRQERRPIAVLIGSQTSGAGERLAHLLVAASRAVTVGQPTAGQPFPIVAVELPGFGDTVRIPQRPAEARWLQAWPPSPIVPVVLVEGGQRRPAGDLPANDELSAAFVDADPCLRRAVDMMATIMAFGQPSENEP